MKRKKVLAVVAGVVVVFAALTSVTVTKQNEYKLIRQFGIIIGDTVLLHFPAAGMQLIDAYRAVDHIIFLLRIFPRGIMPSQSRKYQKLCCRWTGGFRMERIRVSLVHQLIRRGL